MEYEIYEEDILEYINEHQNNNDIKYREAFFMNYLQENDPNTWELLMIIINKYNLLLLPMEKLKSKITDIYGNTSKKLTFSKYLSSIKELDITGICYMLFPILKLYNHEVIDYERLLKLLKYNLDIDLDDEKILENSCINYVLVKQLKVDKSNMIFLPDDKECLKMVKKYEEIYGKENVRKVKGYVKKYINNREEVITCLRN